ncbi:galactose oxidase/kelch, beta-propeller [Artemisia annua]|uniref:Galactose oxidase/kelch, beta-propeller n=1 Tax=Artemisia annua TaxID=35608 RepID=A0A2U1KYJ5_ARTAN|nr:galactose oxidase/kelch, beta-propeller [Artemisia annua]
MGLGSNTTPRPPNIRPNPRKTKRKSCISPRKSIIYKITELYPPEPSVACMKESDASSILSLAQLGHPGLEPETSPVKYSSNQILEDGTAIIVGGREAFSYEIVPPSLEFQPKKVDLPFLKETCTPAKETNMFIENNLYPFLFLLTDGNVFLFANNRSITLNPTSGTIIQEHPVCPGGSRNYPPSGNSAILPLKMSSDNTGALNVEIVICGGNKPDAFEKVDVKHVKDKEKEFVPALKDCHRIHPMDKDAQWEDEQDMPSSRIMGDLLHLPTGDLIMINGAQKGTSGWENAIEPNLTRLSFHSVDCKLTEPLIHVVLFDLESIPTKRQRDDNDLQDERQDQIEEEEVEHKKKQTGKKREIVWT